MKIKTIDINVKEWFDKVNGNSYFAGSVTLNYGMKTEKTLKMPFCYGYGDHYKTVALQLLEINKIIDNKKNDVLWRYCRENNIILRTSKKENCLKRELMNI